MKKARKTLPNQKIIKNHKKEKYNGTFFIMGSNELSIACKELNGTELKVWLYLMKNQPKVEWVLYMVDCTNFTGISSKSYYDAINSLIDKGYIIHEKGSIYGIYDIPINSTNASDMLEENTSIEGGTLEESTRQLSGDNFLEIPEETSRENNTTNNTNEQYNSDADAGDASLDFSAKANGYITNDDTETWIKWCLSIPEIKKLPLEDQGYNNGYYKETANEIECAVIKAMKSTKKETNGIINSEIFTDPVDYGMVINRLMWDSTYLEKKRAYGELNVLQYHIAIVLNQLTSVNINKEREKFKKDNHSFKNK